MKTNQDRQITFIVFGRALECQTILIYNQFANKADAHIQDDHANEPGVNQYIQ
ncbi:MAG: hypothetical protein NMNS01_03580 [Nitrosomonas sp.]|nr:MAG: hypothetical protein NMNS01_03580 [Nitrosomonas sp.]